MHFTLLSKRPTGLWSQYFSSRHLLQGYISGQECTPSHLSPGIRNCPRRKPQGSFFSSVLLHMLFPLFGEFFLFFSFPFQHTSFTWIALPTPFEVNSSATFLGYFLSPCSFVIYSPRIVFFLPSFLSLSFSVFLSLSLSLSFFHRGVCGIILPQPGIDLGPLAES